MGEGLEQVGFKWGEKVLIYGIGNVGRQDDGLGIRLVEKLESANLEGAIALEANYQLNVEDALLISGFDVVLFADASRDASTVAPFSVRPVLPAAELGFSTHAMGFSGVVSLCQELYKSKPRTFLMALPGYEWEVTEELSGRARQNLDQAFDSLLREVSCMKSH